MFIKECPRDECFEEGKEAEVGTQAKCSSDDSFGQAQDET